MTTVKITTVVGARPQFIKAAAVSRAIATLRANLEKAAESRVLENLGLELRRYVAMTLHRPANVDDLAALKGLMGAIEAMARELPVVFPVHPRTRKNLEQFSSLQEPTEGQTKAGRGGLVS